MPRTSAARRTVSSCGSLISQRTSYITSGSKSSSTLFLLGACLPDVRHLVGKLTSLTHGGSVFGSSIMRIAYGIEVDEEPVDYLKMAEDTMTIFSEAFQPGKYLMETFPALRYLPSWMPGATVKRDGERWRPVVWKLVERPWKLAMAAMVRFVSSSRNLLLAYRVRDAERGYSTPIYGFRAHGECPAIVRRE